MSFDESNRKLRLQLYFESQDAFYPYESWPVWVQLGVLAKHKKNNERYRLFLFFVYNGLPPHAALQWVASADIDRQGNLIEGRYDREGVAHFRQLVKNAESGLLQRQAKAIFNMHTGRVENPSERMLDRRPGFYR